MPRTVYSPEFKAKIVIEVLEGAWELEAIAADYQQDCIWMRLHRYTACIRMNGQRVSLFRMRYDWRLSKIDIQNRNIDIF